MTTIVSATSSSPATSPPAAASTSASAPASASASAPAPAQSPNSNHFPLPPLGTSPPVRRTNLSRPMSHASKNRLSQYSTGSIPPRSRPVSHVFPIYPSSLPYALVRDFAYTTSHPLHYGPPPEPSRPSSVLMTPSIDSQSQRRLSDPPPVFWDGGSSGWENGSWTSASFNRATDIPPIYLADGPPWSEDEDLQSPVVSSRHRKHKSASSAYDHRRSRNSRDVHGDAVGISVGPGPDAGAGAGAGAATDNGNSSAAILNSETFDHERGYYMGTGGDGSERYYVSQTGDEANGPGGEYVTYPPDQARLSTQPYHLRPHHGYGAFQHESDASSTISSPGYREDDQSRYSRDYQFTITSPDEEMHGKAVALFDFARENENELPLVEGQIIWVSYRHGQGWLVAMDPKTQESGLVPEEYVRLLRDIEGGMNSLTGAVIPLPADGPGGTGSPNDGGTPTQAEHQGFTAGHTPTPSNVSNGYPQPIVSTFSTSSKDLDPYPQHLLGTQVGQTPPQVIHYHGQRGGSQANTPTLLNHQDVGMMRRGSQDMLTKKGEGHVPSTLGSLPDAELDEAVGAAATKLAMTEGHEPEPI